MVSDPIVDEVHRIREKLLEECGGDLDKYIERLREREKKHPERLAPLAPGKAKKLAANKSSR